MTALTSARQILEEARARLQTLPQGHPAIRCIQTTLAEEIATLNVEIGPEPTVVACGVDRMLA